MSPSLWMPGAQVLPTQTDGGSMTGGERLVTWHYYVCPLTMSALDGASYLNRERKSVHFAFNVLSGQVVQMIPANRAGRGLRNADGGVQTNRRGAVNFQVEVMADSPHWHRDLTPAGRAGLARLMDYFRSWGVPDQWAGTPGQDSDTPNGKDGHTAHRNWTENDHVDWLSADPWALTSSASEPVKNTGSATAKPVVTPPTKPASAPAPAVLLRGSTGPAVKRLQAELGRVFPLYARVTVDGDFGPSTARAVAEFQKRVGLKPDGIVGPATRAALMKHGLRLD